MKRLLTICLAGALALSMLSGCGASTSSSAPSDAGSSAPAPSTAPSSEAGSAASSFDNTQDIVVVSREEGSGTRSAFVELTGVEVKGDDGNKTDRTTADAETVNQTNVMLTSIEGNPYAIGYVSMGSLSDKVKAVKVDGATPTPDAVKSGDYKLARPFMLATKGEGSAAAKDFLSFVLSAEGQKVVTDNKYIQAVESAAAYTSTKPTGKIVIAGSSSVTPVMEKLTEAYKTLNPDVTIEIQQSDSSTGIKAAMDGTCDIGMASRELKDTETAALTPVKIAIDGIAVIVNNENPMEDIAKDSIASIYIGETTTWADVK